MLYAGIGMLANVAASLILFSQIGHVGIAIASSIAGWLNAGLLWFTLTRRGQYRSDPRLRQRLPRILLAALVMGGAVWAAEHYASGQFTQDVALILRVALLGALVALGAVVFFVLAHVTGAVRLAELRDQFRRS